MRPAKPFYTFRYQGTYKVQFRDPESGKLLNRISTGATTKFEADMIAFGWLRDGIPSCNGQPPRTTGRYFGLARVKQFLNGDDVEAEDIRVIAAILLERGFIKTITIGGTPGEELLGDFLLRFWDFDKSPYVKERLGFGHPIGKSHCVRALTRVRKYWIPCLGGKHLSELQQADLIDFAGQLMALGHLSPGTRNAILLVGKTALNWAFGKNLIMVDLTKGLPSISGAKDERGILTIGEAQRIFHLPWPDERMFLANLTAAATGMRASEVVALKCCRLGEDTIQIVEGYVEQQGLGPVKNKDKRTIKVDNRLIALLRKLAAKNPTKSGFVFWDAGRDAAPLDARGFNLALRERLVELRRECASKPEMQLDEAEAYWNGRKIDFHGWRHFAITHASRSNASKKALMRASGHKTEKVFDDYSNHHLDDDLQESGEAFGRAFALISPLSTEEDLESILVDNK